MDIQWTIPTVLLSSIFLFGSEEGHSRQEAVGVTLTSAGSEPRSIVSWLVTTGPSMPAPTEWQIKKELSVRRTFAAQGAQDAVADSMTDTSAIVLVSMEPAAEPDPRAKVRFRFQGATSGVVQVKAGVAGERIDTSAKSAKVSALLSRCTFGVPLDAAATREGEVAWSSVIDASIPEADQVATRSRLAAYRTLVLDVWPVFPAEPVGVGATWRQVEQRLIRDSVVWVQTRWTLSGRDGNQLTLGLARQLDAPPPPGGGPPLHYEQDGVIHVSLEDPLLLRANLTERMATVKSTWAEAPGASGAMLDVTMSSSATVTVEPRRPAANAPSAPRGTSAPSASGGT